MKQQKRKALRYLILWLLSMFMLFFSLNYHYTKQKNQLEIEIRDRQTQIESINEQKRKVQDDLKNQKITNEDAKKKIESLEQKTKELETQLHAKRQREEQLRIAQLQKSAMAAQVPKQIVKPQAAQPVVAQPVSGTCSDWMNQAGITDHANAAFIFNKESGCRPNAVNPSSGAHGVCQSLPGSKMASAGADWATNPITQMRWCQSYAISRYGSWANAVAFWRANRWW